MFKDNLKKYRKEKGFSQNDLAQKLFVSRQCISKWERGITQPDLQALTQLSDLFEVSIDVLIKENKDNTVTLMIEAVCDMVICDDAVITHELTIKFAENGSFQYLKNEILNDGIINIPDYQYRICK